MPRPLAGKHLPDGAPDRPDVAVGVHLLAADRLGRHVVGRALERDRLAVRRRDHLLVGAACPTAAAAQRLARAAASAAPGAARPGPRRERQLRHGRGERHRVGLAIADLAQRVGVVRRDQARGRGAGVQRLHVGGLRDIRRKAAAAALAVSDEPQSFCHTAAAGPTLVSSLEPKSASLRVPRESRMMLSGLMSRWMMPRECRYARPWRICAV